MSFWKDKCVHDWIAHKSSQWNREELRNTLINLTNTLDHDTLEEFFQPDLVMGGFYPEDDNE